MTADRNNFIFFLCPLDGVRVKNPGLYLSFQMPQNQQALRSGRNAAKWCVSGFNDLVLLTTKIGDCIGE